VRDDRRFQVDSPLGRFTVYGLLGWCGEVVFNALHDFARTRDPRLPSRTSLWMFPIYGLLQPLYEPVHERLRGRASVPVRGTIYALGFFAIEYATGALLRRVLGEAPWDYSYAKVHINGLIRPAYFPVWAAAGLGLERVHDRLTGR
jgi:uncharacterized membrane protein